MLIFFLDMSAAFDTVDPGILSDILSSYVGVEGSALLWFPSYVSARSQGVEIGGASSKDTPLQCGVPQGSLLGAVLFSATRISGPGYHQQTPNRLP